MKNINPSLYTSPKVEYSTIGLPLYFVMVFNMNKNINNQEEIWKDIPDYEGLYQVSNVGRVKSLAKTGLKNGRCKTDNIIGGYVIKKGYYIADLRKDKTVIRFYVHQLVLMAFKEYIRTGKIDYIINHIDGNRLNNLEVVTQRYNSSDGWLRCKKSDAKTGVCWDSFRGRYVCKITIDKPPIFLAISTKTQSKRYLEELYVLSLNNLDKFNGNKKEFREYIKSLIII